MTKENLKIIANYTDAELAIYFRGYSFAEGDDMPSELIVAMAVAGAKAIIADHRAKGLVD